MKRYEGTLRPLERSAPWPSRWVVVDVVGRPVSVVDRETLRRTGLESWHAIILTMRGEKHLASEEAAGTAASGLWQLLGVAASRAGPTWVISPRALYAWTLLGLFERLLLGELTVANDHRVRKRPLPDRGLGREPGLFMAADPPSAVSLRLPDGDRRITWVCAANYGWRGACLGVAGLYACRNLAQIVVAASGLLAEHSLGGWCVTIGSMAMRAWRSQHIKESLYVGNDPRVLGLCARAAFGGRLQVSKTTGIRRDCYHADARGLYCEIGVSSLLPCGCRSYVPSGDASSVAKRLHEFGYIARVKIADNGGRFPCRVGEKVTYPLGDMETVLCGAELEAAITGQYVSEMGECCEFRLGRPIADFEQACQRFRSAAEARGDRHNASLGKALAVALVGKLHAYDELWEECRGDYNDPITGQWTGPDGKGGQTQWQSLAGIVSRRKRKGLAAHSLPEIPIWIWSAGRNWLYERMVCAHMSQVWYADTDGLVVSRRGYDRLCDGGYIRQNEWGELRLIRGPVDVEILGPKCLRIGDEIVQAGAPREQRGTDFMDRGYWFRRPFGQHESGYEQGYFEEEYRERQA